MEFELWQALIRAGSGTIVSVALLFLVVKMPQNLEILNKLITNTKQLPESTLETLSASNAVGLQSNKLLSEAVTVFQKMTTDLIEAREQEAKERKDEAAKVTELTKRVTELENELEERDQQIADARTEIANLKKQLEDVQSERQQAQKERDKFEKQVQERDDVIESMKGELKALNTQLQELKTRFNDAATDDKKSDSKPESKS